MSRTLARFFALPRAEQGRALEAACCLLIARIVFAVLPFAWGLRLLGVSPGETCRGRRAAAEARAVACAIARAARHVPFRAVCLQQAFAASLMLRRRGLAATVHLGVTRDTASGTLKAHAWSCCGDLRVTGGAARGFTPVAAFAA